MKKIIKKKVLIVLLMLGFVFVSGFAPAQTSCNMSYEQPEHWAYLPENPQEAVDVFFVSPVITVEKEIYGKNSNFYAPYYGHDSQNFNENMTSQEQEVYLNHAYEDVKAAFAYYLANENGGRPFVLAGFSQGSDVVIRLLKEEFQNPVLQGQLIAAYVPGYDITQEDLKEYPHLKISTCEGDVGTIVPFAGKSPETFYEDLRKEVNNRIKQYLSLQKIMLGGFVRADIDIPLTVNDAYVRTSPNVGAEMLNENYWLYKTSRTEEVLMQSEEIQRFNEQTAEAQKKGNGFYRFAGADGDRSISGEMLTKILSGSKIPKATKYYNGSPVPAEFWEMVSALVNVDAVKEENQVLYGVCLNRGSVRSFPTDAVITSSTQYTFDDDMQNSSIMVNEPVVVLHTSADGNWYYIQTNYCGGWVHTSDVALCKSYDEWQKVCNPEQFLMVTENKLYLDQDPFNPRTSGLELSMGTKLALVPQKNFQKTTEGRVAFDNYVVRIPARDANGMLYYQEAFLPSASGVHVGYLDYTQGNVLRLAFDCLGERYGWGGMYDARDCSQYIMELYRCFGFALPRNSSGMSEMNSTTINVKNMLTADKEALLRVMPVGTILYFPGHVMMYLGETDGRYYVISSVGSFVPQDSESGEILKAHSVMINDLDTKRASGKTWLECVEKYKVLM